MYALKQFLGSQVPGAVNQDLAARGENYPGVGAQAQSSAQNYLGQLAPMTQQQAMQDDFSRLYGSSIGQSLTQGGSTDNANGDSAYMAGFNPAAPSGTPQFGVVDYPSTDTGPQFYPSPGYLYNPNQMPDASKMPWLAPATGQPVQAQQTQKSQMPNRVYSG